MPDHLFRRCFGPASPASHDHALDHAGDAVTGFQTFLRFYNSVAL